MANGSIMVKLELVNGKPRSACYTDITHCESEEVGYYWGLILAAVNDAIANVSGGFGDSGVGRRDAFLKGVALGASHDGCSDSKVEIKDRRI